MRAYIIRRVLLIIPTIFVVSFIVFLMIRLIPGDVVDLLVQESGVISDMTRETIEHALGIDAPIHIQYVRWLGDLFFHGSLGISIWTDRPVLDEVIGRWPVTLELGLWSIITGLIIALPIGIFSAIRQDSIGDYIGRSFAILCISIPGFWLGTMVVVFGSIWIGWSPSIILVSFSENPAGHLLQYLVPATVMGMILSGSTMRMTRTMMLEVLKQDYIRTAWAKGLRERVVIWRHALKNALIPIITIIGQEIPMVLGGIVIIEQIFGLPGTGRLLLDAINNRDFPIVSGVVFIMSIFVMLCTLIVDITYAFFDPRIRYQ